MKIVGLKKGVTKSYLELLILLLFHQRRKTDDHHCDRWSHRVHCLFNPSSFVSAPKSINDEFRSRLDLTSEIEHVIETLLLAISICYVKTFHHCAKPLKLRLGWLRRSATRLVSLGLRQIRGMMSALTLFGFRLQFFLGLRRVSGHRCRRGRRRYDFLLLMFLIQLRLRADVGVTVVGRFSYGTMVHANLIVIVSCIRRHAVLVT
ncbi:hypothetical protein JOM56_002836 [Amanita muscaria]